MKNIEYLKGFKKVGCWILNDKYKSNKSLNQLNLKGINFILDKEYAHIKDCVYAFVNTQEEIIYIGETSNKEGLSGRFRSYRYGFDKLTDTDNNVKIEITKQLEGGSHINILVFKPSAKYDFLGEEITIPLSKPIEEFLISRIAPKINKKVLSKQ